MSKSEILRFLILRSIGNFLVLFAIFGVLATFGPALYYEFQFRLIEIRGIHYTVAAPKEQSGFAQVLERAHVQTAPPEAGFSNIITGPQQQILVPKDTNFSIVIPKIGATAKIIPNVDPTNEKEFLPLLLQGVVHAKGSVFPGIVGNTYLFAHSTDNFWDAGRYNAVFYLLKDLSPGDDVVIFFENRRYNYTVDHSQIVDPSDVSNLVNSQKSGQEQLIMQTCWPPGTTWKRLLVFAKRK